MWSPCAFLPTHACSYIWLTHLTHSLHTQTDTFCQLPALFFLATFSLLVDTHTHSVPCFSHPTFLPRCDHTSPSLPPPSFPLTLSSSVPLLSFTLTVTSRLRWHLISISLPPQTCNICSPLFLSSFLSCPSCERPTTAWAHCLCHFLYRHFALPTAQEERAPITRDIPPTNNFFLNSHTFNIRFTHLKAS